MFNKQSSVRNGYMIEGSYNQQGYDWWWHSFTGRNEKTNEEKAFFVEFFICNSASSPNKVMYGQDGSGNKPCYLMIKCGTWGENHKQLHRFIETGKTRIQKAPIVVEVDDCYLSETKLKGHVCVSDSSGHPEYMCDDGEMSFDLNLNKQIAFNVGYGTCGLFRKLKAFEMYWHAQGMKTLVSGVIELDGEKYIVEDNTSYGYADKNWGKDFTSPWVWLSSNDIISKKTGNRLNNTVFDIGGGCPCVFGVKLPRQLLSAMYYEGEEYEFNFSKFWSGCKTEFDCVERENEIYWHVVQTTHKAKMDSEFTCQKKDMLLVNYEAPNGKKLHNRLWNGGNGVGNVKLYKRNGKEFTLIDELECGHVGCEFGEYDK